MPQDSGGDDGPAFRQPCYILWHEPAREGPRPDVYARKSAGSRRMGPALPIRRTLSLCVGRGYDW